MTSMMETPGRMDPNRAIEALAKLLRDTTVPLRKGEQTVSRDAHGIQVKEIFDMPHVDEVEGFERVDCHFIEIGVVKNLALACQKEFEILIDSLNERELLAEGPSYIHMGAVLEDQQLALQLFALGHVLKLWEVIIPASLGYDGYQADQLAGQGFVMITGYPSP